MVATNELHKRALAGLTRIRGIVEEHGNDEHKERLDRIMGGPIPAPNRRPTEFMLYQTEALVILFEMFAEMKAASARRPRGRPRKTTDKGDEAA